MTTTGWPDLTALDLLVRIGTTGSLGAAAREARMAQPNASRTIRRLEHDLGLQLVRRSTRGSTLTPNGALIAEWATAVLRPARELGANAAALRLTARARLAVGASRTIAEYAVPSWLSALRREHAEVHVTLEVDNSTVVCDRVRSGHHDVGFVEGPGRPTDLRSAVVAVDELVVIVAPDHPWARRRTGVTAAEVAATPLVVREEGSGTRTTFEHALAGTGLGSDLAEPALELASNEAVRISVASGAGPAVLSELAVRAGVENGQVVRVAVRDLPLHRRLRAVWRGPDRLDGPAAELVRIARALGTGPSGD